MVELTLLRQQHPLSSPAKQVEYLEGKASWPTFSERLHAGQLPPLRATGLEVLQVNVGKVCNQTCRHCHVDAGPDRRESMSREVVNACLDLLRTASIPVLDITGGAPEMNPHFRHLVTVARELGCRVIDRCNLTILVSPGFMDFPEFLANQQVEIVASLPCYLEENVNRQRGDHVFEKSIDALKRLNTLGYGQNGSGLTLNLVFNPGGTSLPPPQATLEADYRRELKQRYGIEFSRLHTITNMPISRFLEDLLRAGKYDQYLQKLVDAFNPRTLPELMCRTMLSVDWRGDLYDCDFNQMLELPVANASRLNVLTLTDALTEDLKYRPVVTGRHCFGCTAGAGSSCGGQLTAT